MDGVINVVKPKDWTSFDVIAKLRRIYHQKKIGHGGTLDPMAEGVLPVFLGRAARLIEYAPIHTKTYEASFRMGLATDTEDMTGQVVEEGPLPEDLSVFERAAEKFRGPIMQVPSSYSALKIKGERAYKLAREGKKSGPSCPSCDDLQAGNHRNRAALPFHDRHLFGRYLYPCTGAGFGKGGRLPFDHERPYQNGNGAFYPAGCLDVGRYRKGSGGGRNQRPPSHSVRPSCTGAF